MSWKTKTLHTNGVNTCRLVETWWENEGESKNQWARREHFRVEWDHCNDFGDSMQVDTIAQGKMVVDNFYLFKDFHNATACGCCEWR